MTRTQGPVRILLAALALTTVAFLTPVATSQADASVDAASTAGYAYRQLSPLEDLFAPSESAIVPTTDDVAAIAYERDTDQTRFTPNAAAQDLEPTPWVPEAYPDDLRLVQTSDGVFHALYLEEHDIAANMDTERVEHVRSDTWTSQTVYETEPNVEILKLDVAKAHGEEIHALFRGTGLVNLQLLSYDGAAWSTHLLGHAAMTTDLAIDAGGTVHLCYVSFVGLVYQHGHPGVGWQREIVDRDGGYGCSIDVTDAGTPHIIYAESESSEDGEETYPVFRYVVLVEDTWRRETVPVELGSGSPYSVSVPSYDVGLDGEGNAYLGYYHALGSESSSGYVSNRAGAWADEQLEGFSAVNGPEVEQRLDGQPPHVTYDALDLPVWSWQEGPQ